MMRANFARFIGRIETFVAVGAFGAASCYWLVLAFAISADDYGVIMTLQAIVMLVASTLTIRTHDLTYYLVSKFNFTGSAAWRKVILVEFAAAALCSILASILAITFGPRDLGGTSELTMLSILAAAVILQQASVARLRIVSRERLIVAADFTMLMSWGFALLYIVVARPSDLVVYLILGAMPQAIRTAVLLITAIGLPADELLPNGLRAAGWRDIATFLGKGQIVNTIKNGATSYETLILASFAPPATIAIFRLSKSALGLSSAAGNVAFQQGFKVLANVKTAQDRAAGWHDVRRRSLRVGMVTFPATVVFALVYALKKDTVDPLTMQLVNAAVFLAFLPNLLLQASFILLTLEDKQLQTTMAYLLSLAVLASTMLFIQVFPSIWLFLGGLLLSAAARNAYLDLLARRHLRPGRGETHDPSATPGAFR